MAAGTLGQWTSGRENLPMHDHLWALSLLIPATTVMLLQPYNLNVARKSYLASQGFEKQWIIDPKRF